MPRDPDRSKPARDPGPRAWLRSLERHLREERWVDDDVAHEAQQLVYDAWEAPTDEDELELMKEALKRDPTNMDAMLHLLSTLDLPENEEIEALRDIVAVGEKRLGPRGFREYAGAFWGFLETRPYMRARERFAEHLRAADRLEEAVEEWEAMLELNPGDNQGVRYALLPALLNLGRLDRVPNCSTPMPASSSSTRCSPGAGCWKGTWPVTWLERRAPQGRRANKIRICRPT